MRQRLPHFPILVAVFSPFTLVACKTLATREADASLPDANATMSLPHGHYGHSDTTNELQMNCKMLCNMMKYVMQLDAQHDASVSAGAKWPFEQA